MNKLVILVCISDIECFGKSVTGLFKTAVKLLVDVLPDCVTCRFDDHVAFDRRIVNQLCFLNNIGVPLCKIFLHRGDLLY